MRTLVYFVHADPSVRSKYEAALAPLGDVDIVFVNAGAYSGAYQTLGEKLRKDGRVLPQLRLAFPPPREGYGALVVVTFSAGYALARALLRSTADRDAIDALVMLDSLHAGFDGDHTAADAQIEPFADFARLARDGRKVFYLGHTDVHTPQTGAGAFASTTQAAAKLVRLAGDPTGAFVVRAFDTTTDEMQEHRDALNVWGPAFVAEALSSLRDARQQLDTVSDTDPAELLPGPSPAPSPWTIATGASWGEAVLARAKWWLNRAPREDEGHNRSSDDIDRWLRAVGVALGSPYCAAFASTCIREAADALGRAAPVAGSAGAKALGAQFQRLGLTTPRGPALRDSLRPGDLLIWDRSQPGPGERGPQGHVQIVIDVVGERSVGVIEANADRIVEPVTGQLYAVCQSEKRLDDSDLLYACHWPD